VPPYLLAVIEEAWENSWNRSGVMPMPVFGVACQVEQGLSEAGLPGVDRAESAGQSMMRRLPFFVN
jgi:hypothetical protein